MAPAWPLLEAAGLPAQVMLANLASAIAVTSALVSSGVTVRWLKYSGSLTRHKYGFGMTALNSTETRMTCYSPDVFLQQLYLTAINVRSLVFKFSDGGHPEILFCADSNLSFTAKTQPITLIANSLVTAPHHGAATCDEAYDCIAGSDLIYVRSDEGRAGNPGKDGFLKQANRYCTICRQGKTKRQKKKLEVEVLYTGCVPPTVTGRRCECM